MITCILKLLGLFGILYLILACLGHKIRNRGNYVDKPGKPNPNNLIVSGTVRLEIEFNMFLWPFFPPKVTPIFPQLKSYGLGKLICMNELTLNKWNPLANVTELV